MFTFVFAVILFAILKLAELRIAFKILAQSTHYPIKYTDIEQVINYDTTFGLTKYYVSVLTMKNIELEGSPAFPIIYLMHDKKHKEIHGSFWRDRVIRCLQIPDRVPIVTDREESIVWAIKNNQLSKNLLHCRNHLLRDVKMWLRSHNVPYDNYQVYRNMIDDLISASTIDHYQEKLEKHKSMMVEGFREYFEKHIEGDLRNHLAHFIAKKFPAFRQIAPNTNLAEGCNTMLKNYLGFKKRRPDILVLRLLELQLEKLDEFNRAIKGYGDHRLKHRFKSSAYPLSLDCHLHRQSIPALISKLKIEVKGSVNDEPSETIEEHIAEICVDQKLIGWDPLNQVHTVKGPFSGDVFLVSKDKSKGKLKCSCSSSKRCSHIIAVEDKVSVTESIESSRTDKLSNIDKKLKRGKSGTKKPRKIDYQIPFLSADNSDDDEKSESRKSSETCDKNSEENLITGNLHCDDFLASEELCLEIAQKNQFDSGTGYMDETKSVDVISNDFFGQKVSHEAGNSSHSDRTNDSGFPKENKSISFPPKALHFESQIPNYLKLTRNRALHSLVPGSWIMSTVLEDFIQHSINCFEKTHPFY